MWGRLQGVGGWSLRGGPPHGPNLTRIMYSNNSSLSLIVTLTPTSCMMPWSKLGGVLQVYIKFLH